MFLFIDSVAMRLTGHTAELSNCLWNFDHKLIATSSIDFTARLWDIRGARSCYVIDGHSDEVLDICFNFTGKLLATCSNDCTCKIWNTETDFQLISTMLGHSDEISRVCLLHQTVCVPVFICFKSSNLILLYTKR